MRYNQGMHSLLQTKEWAALRETQGWQAHWIDEILILEKKLPFGKSFLYAPEVDFNAINKLQDFLDNINKNTKNRHTIFIRLEILDKFTTEIDQKMLAAGFIKSFEELQPEWRQIIEISKTEEEILAQMKEKGRYNIRVAIRNNIVIEKSQNLDLFYKIFQETSKRDGFEIRPKQYFINLLAKLEPPGFAELLVARYNGEVIAAEIATYFQETASYLYGASSSENRNLMTPYLLHFEAIKRAKERGCRYYDLLAVASENIESHKYAGITSFKEQFGGEKVHLAGSYDYIYKPIWYKLFKIAETFRRK